MKTSLSPLLPLVACALLFASTGAMAQEVFQQAQPPVDDYGAVQPETVLPPGEYDINDRAESLPESDESAGESVYGYHQTPDGEMIEGSLMIDNALWDGAAVGPCCASCGGGSNCPPDWYAEQGVRILTRSRPREQVISRDYYTGNAMLSSRSAAPDVSAAYSTTIGHYFARDRLNRDHFVEFSFWGINEWKDKAERRDLNNYLVSEFYVNGDFLPGFDYANYQSTYYASYTNNFELNGRFSPRGRPDRLVLLPNGKWRRECQPGTYMSYLYGLRFFQENETFHFHSEAAYEGFTDVYTGDYNIASHNNLLGFQVGADITFRKCRWHWGIRAKLGPYINFSDQQSTVTSGVANAPSYYNRRLAAAKHEASLLGETGFFASYRFRPNLIGRASYDFMWVTGMALAPEQFQFTTNTVNQVNTNGSIFYQGVSMSLEWLW